MINVIDICYLKQRFESKQTVINTCNVCILDHHLLLPYPFLWFLYPNYSDIWWFKWEQGSFNDVGLIIIISTSVIWNAECTQCTLQLESSCVTRIYSAVFSFPFYLCSNKTI